MMRFRMVFKRLDVAVVEISRKLRENGFKIYDLLESAVVRDSDGSEVESVYILCCQGEQEEYEQFKNQQNLEEIIYEGFKTLM